MVRGCQRAGAAVSVRRLASILGACVVGLLGGAGLVVPEAASAATIPPVIAAVTPGNHHVTVSWTEGSPSGLAAVVTASPGGATCTTTTESCTVGHLTNGTTYTFVVTVTGGGSGSATSAESSPVLPANPSVPWQVAEQRSVQAGCPANPFVRVNILQWFTPPPLTVTANDALVATVTTDLGVIRIRLEPRRALQTVNSFVFLSDQGYFNCVIFHRVITGFVDQTGDPTGTGFGGPGYTLPDEFPPKAADRHHQFALGDVAMANTGAPHSGGSQFFFVMGKSAERLPHRYALFGHIIGGYKVAQAINASGTPAGSHPVAHRMLSVTVANG